MKRYELKEKDFLKSSVFATAFVTSPAIEVGLIYLNSEKEPSYKVKLEKGIAYSPVLIPDQYIPRVTEDGEEFEVYFTSETIEGLSQKYMQAGSPMKNWNSQHNDTQKLEGISVVENWIVEDPESDKATRLGFKVPKGTWMQGIKVDNETVREKIKSGEYFGISIEGDFDHVVKLNKQESILKEMGNIRETLTKLAEKLEGKQKFESVRLEDGTVLYFDGSELKEGESMLYVDEELTAPAPVGVHTLEGGKTIEVAEGGMLAAVREVEMKEKKEEMAEEFDKEDVIGKVTVANSESIEALQKENLELKEALKANTEKFEALEKEVKDHTVKLGKVKAPESVTKLESTVSDKPSYLNNRINY